MSMSLPGAWKNLYYEKNKVKNALDFPVRAIKTLHQHLFHVKILLVR
jgi:hypothetical protein